MTRYASLAEQYRAHREAFVLALELGCTIREAERLLRDRARARRRACGTRVPDHATADFETISEQPTSFDDFDCRWMMRE